MEHEREFEERYAEAKARHSRATSEAMADAASAGRFPGCAPVGYLNAAGPAGKGLEIDPIKAPLVREAFRLAAVGMVPEKISEALWRKGLRSRRGKRMGQSAVRRMLANPVYLGFVRWDGMLAAGCHEPIVDSAAFAAAQRGIAGRSWKWPSDVSALGLAAEMRVPDWG